MKWKLFAATAAVAVVGLAASGATTVSAAGDPARTSARPPACAAESTPVTPPPAATTLTTVGQAYYCILDHYFSGPTMDDRPLLQAAFGAFVQELRRRNIDQSDAVLPALTGNHDKDWAVFAAAYQQADSALPADPELQTAVAQATLTGMVNSLHDDHAGLVGGQSGNTLGMRVSAAEPPGVPDPTATAPAYVTSVTAGGPAEAAGVRPGDEIVSVNGAEPFVNGVVSQGVLNWLLQPSGPVRLALHRPSTDATLTVTVTPAPSSGGSAPSGTVTSLMLPGGVAYVEVPAFGPGVADQALAAIAQLRSTTALTGVVLDLRGNGGGLGDEETKLLSAFVHGAVLNYFCDAQGHCTANRTDDSIALVHLPLVTLVDHDCASACDAFSNAVRDLHVGTLVGTRTAGAVSGPAYLYLLDDNSTLRLPTQHMLGADREIVDGIGVPPDYQAPVTAADLSAGRDPGVAKALDILTGGADPTPTH